MFYHIFINIFFLIVSICVFTHLSICLHFYSFTYCSLSLSLYIYSFYHLFILSSIHSIYSPIHLSIYTNSYIHTYIQYFWLENPPGRRWKPFSCRPDKIDIPGVTPNDWPSSLKGKPKDLSNTVHWARFPLHTSRHVLRNVTYSRLLVVNKSEGDT